MAALQWHPDRAQNHSRQEEAKENFQKVQWRVNLFSKKIARQFETKPKTKTATKTKTKRVKTPTGRALRAPLAGSPAFVFVFVAVFVFGFVSN